MFSLGDMRCGREAAEVVVEVEVRVVSRMCRAEERAGRKALEGEARSAITTHTWRACMRIARSLVRVEGVEGLGVCVRIKFVPLLLLRAVGIGVE